MFGDNSNQTFSFTEGERIDGYQWYIGTALLYTPGYKIPLRVIEIAVRDAIEGSQRVISIKFRGHFRKTTLSGNIYSERYWSRGGTYDDPGSIVIATLPLDNTDCFVMDSIDLGALGVNSSIGPIPIIELERT
jgi:hypothetical protein